MAKNRNSTSQNQAVNNSATKSQLHQILDIAEIQYRIEQYNKFQTVLNEDIFGPLQNDSLVIIIQVRNF